MCARTKLLGLIDLLPLRIVSMRAFRMTLFITSLVVRLFDEFVNRFR